MKTLKIKFYTNYSTHIMTNDEKTRMRNLETLTLISKVLIDFF